MIIFLYGKDTYRRRAHLHKMMEKFKADRDPQGLNTVRVDCSKEPQKVMEQVLAAPFLAERRMVVVEHLLASKQKELQQEILKRIEEKNLPDTNVVVFWEATDAYKTKDAKALLARLQKEKYAQQFDVLKGVQLGGWVAGEVAARKGKISSHATQYLIQHTNDSWQLSSLVDQLVAYKQGEEIGVADVQLFLDETADDNIFNLVDAIVGKQPRQAYAMIQQQYAIGEDVQFMFAMLLRQFRILIELRDLFERDDAQASNVLAKKLGLHPFVVKKSLPLAKRYTLEQLRQAYQLLLDLDIQIKHGEADQELLLDVFVGKVCA